MVNQVFVIADTHFGHKRIIEPNMEKGSRSFNTIEEHDAEELAYEAYLSKKRESHEGNIL